MDRLTQSAACEGKTKLLIIAKKRHRLVVYFSGVLVEQVFEKSIADRLNDVWGTRFSKRCNDQFETGRRIGSAKLTDRLEKTRQVLLLIADRRSVRARANTSV